MNNKEIIFIVIITLLLLLSLHYYYIYYIIISIINFILVIIIITRTFLSLSLLNGLNQVVCLILSENIVMPLKEDRDEFQKLFTGNKLKACCSYRYVTFYIKSTVTEVNNNNEYLFFFCTFAGGGERIERR